MSSKVTMIHNNEIVSDITFKNVADNYVEEQQLTLRPNSINKYVFLLDKHILPELGDVPFQQINHEKIKLFLDRKSSDGRLDHSGGLSGNTLNDILVLIKSIIIYGENKYNLHINLGKFQFKKNMQLTERFYTKEDIKTLLEQAWKEYSADSRDLRCLGVLLCMYTGLRIGELCALRWEDINIKSGILYVRNSMHRLVNNETDKKTQLVIASPKTQNSTRMIPIKSNILKILSEIQTQYIETDFLLSGKSDKLIEPRNLQYYFKKLQLRAGIEPLCFHSLRHTFASICIQSGMDIKTLSEILGHANINITLSYYVHSTMEYKQKQIEAFEY